MLEQDREMLTNIPTDAHKREMLYQHDVGVARMRRMLSQQVKQPARGRGHVLGADRGRVKRGRCSPGEPSSSRVPRAASGGRSRAPAPRRARALVLGDVLVEAGRDGRRGARPRRREARFVADRSQRSAIDRRRSRATSRSTRAQIHGLVNNAAIATNVGGKPFDEIDLDLWDRVMRVNVRGTWLVTRALGAAHRRRRATAASSMSPPTPRCGARRGSSPTWRARAR